MAMLCFVLDLRSLSPSIFRVLKQSLLQLANFYSISASTGNKSRSQIRSDRIGLCYIFTDRISCSDELKVAYAPSDEFSLRKFHHAVNSLPTDAFSPKINDSGALSVSDMKFDSFLSSKLLYKWGGHEKDVSKKVILISSCVSEELDSVKKDILMDAAEKCISIEFLLLEPESSHLGDLSENINNFVKQISDLENCSFHAYLPDPQVLCGLVKRWLLDLKDDVDEPLQARFIFKNNIFGYVNRLSCTLSATSFPLIDEFSPCQKLYPDASICGTSDLVRRACHGIPLDNVLNNKTKQLSSCPVSGKYLEHDHLVENSLKVGDQTLLLLHSFGDYEKLHHVSQPVDLNVIERTSLGSLSEAVLFGTSFLVSPSAYCDSDDVDKSNLNTQVFQGLCSSLHSLDQGLVCSSKCNIETKREVLFHCYYILEPSEKGQMLLRRLAGSEEVLPFPDVSQLISSSATSEIGKSVLASLLKIEARDYNPSLHERGFHQKLNSLVKESLQPGGLISTAKHINIEPEAFQCGFSDYSAPPNPTPNPDVVILEDVIPKRVDTLIQDQVSDRITEEWEQLVVCEGPKISSPKFVPTTKLDQAVPMSQDSSRKMDEKTSRILERLEVPRQLKRKSPTVKSTASVNPDLCLSSKAPLIPFPPINGSQQSTSLSQPMKPNFQRNKKKQR